MKKAEYLKSSIEDCKRNLELKKEKNYDNEYQKKVQVGHARHLLIRKIKEEKKLSWLAANQYFRYSL